MCTYGDSVKVKEDMYDASCPFCGKQEGQVIRDFTGLHEKEVLIHCDNPDCDELYLRIYKYSHTVKLVRTT